MLCLGTLTRQLEVLLFVEHFLLLVSVHKRPIWDNVYNTRHSLLLHNFDPVCLYKIMPQKTWECHIRRVSNANLYKLNTYWCKNIYYILYVNLLLMTLEYCAGEIHFIGFMLESHFIESVQKHWKNAKNYHLNIL